MKKLQLAGALAACAIAPVALASHEYFREPYVGVEVIQTNQKFKSGAGDDLFKKNPLDYSVFAGFKFSHCFGAEAGFEVQSQKKRTVSETTTEFGAVDTFNTTNKVKGTHPYVGLFGEYKHQAWRFQALLAASFSTVKTNVYFNSSTNAAVATAGTTLSAKKTKVVPMVKLNAQYDFNHHFAGRVTATYRNTSQIKTRVNANTGGYDIKLRDTFGVGVGVMYMF